MPAKTIIKLIHILSYIRPLTKPTAPMRKLFPFLIIFIFCFGLNAIHAQPSGKTNFDAGWKFNLGDVKQAEQTSFQDQSWRSLNLPHDWSIEGSFSPDNPATNNGGALPGGIGWYRKNFMVVNPIAGTKFFIEFDGVYMNRYRLGKRPFAGHPALWLCYFSIRYHPVFAGRRQYNCGAR